MAQRIPDGPGGGGLLGYFVRHGTAANLLLAAMVLLGLAGAFGIRAQLSPDVVTETASVTVVWRGAGPEEVDRGIVQALEPALMEIDGVERLTSIAQERRARITLEFEPGRDMTSAMDEISAAVDGVTLLPPDADPPRVSRGGWREKVTDVVIHGPVPLDQIALYGAELRDRLRARGLTRSTLLGHPPPVVRVTAPEASLRRHDLTLGQIAAALREAAQATPGGETGGGAARLSAGTEQRTPQAVGGVVVRTLPEGGKLRVRDVAQVEDVGPERGRRFYVEGAPAVVLRVERDADGDSLRMLADVREAVAEIAPTLPEGVKAELVHTLAGMIAGRLGLLIDNAIAGLALVGALLFLFLNARTAVWVAAGIPAALMAAVGMMWLSGVTLNLVSLFALILVLGMVVDDAIVVGEHADAMARRGLPPALAAETAARRMLAPVFAATLTTVLAFSAILAIGGRFGAVIEDIPITVGLVLIASLAECFLILPHHMRHAAGASADGWIDAPSRLVNRGFGWFRSRAFRPAMAFVVRVRYPALGAALLLLALSVEQLATGAVQWRFWTAPERNSISGNAAMLPSAQWADTLAQVRLMEETVHAVGRDYEAEHGLNPIRFILSEMGGWAGGRLSAAEGKEPWQLGAVSVELIDADLRPYSSHDVTARVQERIERHPLAEAVSFRGQYGGPGGDGIAVALSGAEPATLKAASEALQAALSVYPEVTGLEDSLAYDKTELTLELTPLGRALGFTPETLGNALRDRLSGIVAAEFPVDGRTGRIVVRAPREERAADFLHRARVRAPSGDWVPIGALAEATASPGFSTLRREDGRLTVAVTGGLSEDDPERAAEVQRALAEEILPDIAARFAVEWELSGLARQEREFLADARIGFALAVAGIYIVLAWVFASWTRPLAVLLVIPFGLIGAVWGHRLMDVPFSMFSVVGLIGMTGIIVNDSIVLVATIEEYARRRALIPALLDAVCDRLRPVLLTTLTTVIGLAPLLLETSQQAQFLKPTIITLCFGLGFGLLLVLLVTPALVLMQRDVAAALTSARRMARRLTARRTRGSRAGGARTFRV